jgi:hypothetical protein
VIRTFAMHPARIFLLLVLVTGGAAGTMAQKVDSICFQKGDRLNGSVSSGFSYIKASDIMTLNLNGSIQKDWNRIYPFE